MVYDNYEIVVRNGSREMERYTVPAKKLEEVLEEYDGVSLRGDEPNVYYVHNNQWEIRVKKEGEIVERFFVSSTKEREQITKRYDNVKFTGYNYVVTVWNNELKE
jgi:hypothetical protein